MKGKILAALVVWLLAIAPAWKYGGIWNIQSHPVKNVTAHTKAGEMHGTLSRDWNQEWVLTTDAGTSFRFLELPTISVPIPGAASTVSVFESWRSFVPAILLTALFLVFSLVVIQREGSVANHS